MAILGTKKFWKPAIGASTTQRENQILKNSGYLNLQLHSVNYMSRGNFWQNTFGGSDKIALATNLKYQSGVDSIEATSVQDVREVEVNHNYNLGLQRNIAIKIPVNADAISIDVKMTAVKDDLLQAKFDMLNKPEYQSALQLAPTVVGQVLTITSLVKNLFSDSDPDTQLEASYAGIISKQSEDNPVSNGKLTKGMLIMISTDEGDQFEGVNENDFELRGDSLYYQDNQVENTYVVFNISFEPLKGDNENANWFKKYNAALNNLNKIMISVDDAEKIKIFNDSKNMWIEGNALIDADASYINNEKLRIKAAAIKTIKEKYIELTTSDPIAFSEVPTDILGDLTGATSFDVIREAFPETGSLIDSNLEIISSEPLNILKLKDLNKDERLIKSLNIDTDKYLKELKEHKIPFHLNQKK